MLGTWLSHFGLLARTPTCELATWVDHSRRREFLTQNFTDLTLHFGNGLLERTVHMPHPRWQMPETHDPRLNVETHVALPFKANMHLPSFRNRLLLTFSARWSILIQRILTVGNDAFVVVCACFLSVSCCRLVGSVGVPRVASQPPWQHLHWLLGVHGRVCVGTWCSD
jgi:hypothetical protein